MHSQKPVLLVEDDHVDAMTLKRAFRDLKVYNKLEIVDNGEEAIAYLSDTKNEKPCIILLDLNMPKMNGLEFLSVVKKNKKLRRIPVVIMTTSKDEEDKLSSFDLGVAGYMINTFDYSRVMDIVRTIDLYWTESELPPDGG